MTAVQVLAAIPALVGSIYSILCMCAVLAFAWRARRHRHDVSAAAGGWPPVTVLRPLHGLEKDLAENLRSACTQDYPEYQVVLSVQRLDDPALPLVRGIEREFGAERVTVVVADSEPVVNGKVQNLVGAYPAARHDVLVISDSDVRLTPDYLRTIVAPLRDPQVGYTCTLYRAVRAERWYERFELLTLNTEFVANVIFSAMTGASSFCLGASMALRRETLERAGGFAPLADYLVEDFELGRRVRALGLRMVLVPAFVDTVIDLATPADWWRHQVYWDQNTRAARPIGFFATVVIRAVPFALLFALARGFDALGLGVLAGATAVRLATAAVIALCMGDREGLRNLPLLPLRDVTGLASWVVAMFKKTFVWRGLEFGLTRDGRIVARDAAG